MSSSLYSLASLLYLIAHIFAITFKKPTSDITGPGKRSKYSNCATSWTIRYSNPGRGNRFSVLQDVQTGSGADPASYLMGIGRFFFPGVKRPGGGEVDHLSPTSADIKNEWSYTFTHICLHRMDSDNTFTADITLRLLTVPLVDGSVVTCTADRRYQNN